MKKWRTELKRLFVVLLTAALVGNTIDFSALTVSAETAGQTEESSAVIVSFGELSEEVREQLLPVGANESDIIFPATLTVTVEKTAPEEETGTGEETVSGGDAGEGTDGQIITEDITLENITWELDADNSDSDTFLSDESANGYFYTYVPVLPETVTLTDSEGEVCDFTLTLDKNVYLPEIYVLVGDSGIATFSDSEDGHYDDYGFCTGYELNASGNWVKKAGDDACTDDNCNGYEPANLTTGQYDIDGDGTKDNVYEIGNAGQLYWFADKVNSGDTGINAVLTANITVNTGDVANCGGTKAEGWKDWTPIGGSSAYTGIFDGNNRTISGLYYNVTTSNSVVYVGLFGRNAGTIKNVGVENSYFGLDFSGKAFWCGGLCGFNAGTIENCNYAGTVSVSGTISIGGYVGGICGHNGTDGIIKKSINAGKVSSTVSDVGVGGICGTNCKTIESCSNTGKVSGTENVGGVCGRNDASSSSSKATIKDSYNAGKVSGTNNVGGVCGYNIAAGGIVEITNCYNTGAVTGTSSVGGVSGYNEGLEVGEPSTITNCYNTGVVSGTSYVGGVTGYNCDFTLVDITNCYNTGAVSGTSSVGGVIGYNVNSGGKLNNCYYLEGCSADGTTFSSTEGTSKSADEFGNGSVCYLLNGGTTDGSQVWYQLLETETYPNLDSTNSRNRTVYQCAPCTGVYSNEEGKSAEHSYIPYEGAITKHICEKCGNLETHYTTELTYTANDTTDKITVTCGECSGDLGTISLSAPTGDLTYDGNAKEAVISNNVTGVTISNPTITYKQGGNTLSSAPKAAGTYTASITLGTGEGEATVSVEFTIEKATPELGTVSVTPLSDTLDTSEVEFNRTGTTVSGTFALKDVTELQYGTHDYSYVFTPTGDDAVNYKQVEGTVSITVNDTIKPTAEYQIGENGWKKFVNTISFGLFCEDYKTVEIKYSDVNASDGSSSGVKTKQYYIADKELTSDEIADLQWKDYTSAISLNAEGVYFIYVRVEDKAGNSVVFSDGIVIYAESTLSPTSMDYTYKENKDLEVQITMNGNTFGKLTYEAGTEIAAENYTIDASGTLTLKKDYLDTLTVGEYTYKVYMNPQGQTTDTVTLTYSFVVNVKAQELTVTGATATSRVYDTTNEVAITEVTLSGVKSGENVSVNITNLTGTLSSANVGAYTSVTLPALTLTGADAENYTLVQPTGAVPTDVTISKADATITVGTTSYDKTFGDAGFTLNVTDTNTEANVQYEVTTGNDVISVSNGTVTILKAGTATITVSLPASTNYNAAEDKTITVTVAKNGNYRVEEVNRSYLYSRDNADTIDLSKYLPANCGTVTYGTAQKSGTVEYTVSPAVADGKLSYTVGKGSVGAAGTIQVAVTTDNYADFTITVNVKLTDKLPVSLKEGSSVTLQNITLTYGQALSTLTFNSAVFVDGDGNEVAGTLAWKTPDEKPNAGTTSATWVFTPNDASYATVEDAVAITVNKATPVVTNLPTVTDRTYNPTVSLTDTDLVGGTVNVSGSWSWQTANIIPTVNNSGYVAVFTPSDSTNYETVTKTITVTVTKATPYIATAPTAAAITYGDTIGASALTGGTVQYSDSNTTTVSGSFAWKDSSVKPSVSDSNSMGYRVVFTPSDADNYNTVETDITLTVNKAGNAPNMPSSTMNVANSCEKVSDVTLPTGWVWQDADKNTELTVDTAVTATAEYNGADKGNYENETVSVTITRSACDHAHTELRNAKEATCTETGYIGDTYCTDCGALLTTGSVTPALGHNYTGKVTTEPTTDNEGVRTYTCDRCGHSYTESIPKLPEEEHQHSYSDSVTKEPTCTDTGIRTYTCSCGDSYTETIPALGHNYTSKVTKEPTTDSEGVMTYTCDRCGHSYTRAIAKLQDNNNNPGENQPGGENTPDIGKPYIKDETGKEGWEVIKAEVDKTQDGDTVVVEMNGSSVVPGDVLDEIKGKDVTIVFDMGNGITWSVNGQSITSDKIGDIDFSVKIGTTTIPVDVINNVTGERYSQQISLAYDGEFGFTAVLSINMEAGNAGLYANLFYFNEKTGELEFICADEIAEDGTAELTFTHASDYVIAIDTEPMDVASNETDDTNADVSGTSSESQDTETEATQTSAEAKSDAWNPWWIIVIGIMVIVIGLGVFFVAKKHKSEDE